ncbi:hypothetical protein JTE90_002549 [Oedothorax gibbosus]|uniref:Uncharacterized protein n=1 Tax=Oedothorax gibbosus TaxID=931172 RepID=A0AAV6V4J2_9ARAC|nr:hypothetical protein JTE90_002549 [Oedothorax gibbosus]
MVFIKVDNPTPNKPSRIRRCFHYTPTPLAKLTLINYPGENSPRSYSVPRRARDRDIVIRSSNRVTSLEASLLSKREASPERTPFLRETAIGPAHDVTHNRPLSWWDCFPM